MKKQKNMLSSFLSTDEHGAALGLNNAYSGGEQQIETLIGSNLWANESHFLQMDEGLNQAATVGDFAAGGLAAANDNANPNAGNAGNAGNPQYASHRLILKFTPGAKGQEQAFLNNPEIVSHKKLPTTQSIIIKLPEHVSIEDAVARYTKTGHFEYVEPDYLIGLDAVPNDPSFSLLWGLNNTGQTVNTITGVSDADIDAPEAWNIQTGNPNLVIGVIDSGVDWTHPDLANNIWTNPNEIAGDGIDNDNNGYIDDIRGWDFVGSDLANPAPDNNPMGFQSHGTHVAGTIAASGNNGIGITGVAWNAKIMPLKVGGDNPASGSLSTIAAIEAIDYATNMGVKITNNSWGGSVYSQALSNVISATNQQGALFIAAAGNGGGDGIGDNNDALLFYPSGYNFANIISVAATTSSDVLASYSNYGATSVDLAAPGSNIYSTLPGNLYGYKNGTSMATPQVSGAAALLWSQHPDWTAAQVKNALLANVDALAVLAGKTVSGGRLNINNALLNSGASSGNTVAVDVNPGSVSEDGGSDLVYSLTRSGDLSAPLTVSFVLGGNANPASGSMAVDYAVLPDANVTFNTTTQTGTVTFAAGIGTVQVTIDPLADGVAELANETVTFAINNGSGYSAQTPNFATGIITSNEIAPTVVNTFSNNSSITIPTSGVATLYPAPINVSGLSGKIVNTQASVFGLTHARSVDVNVRLLSPSNQLISLLADAGWLTSLNNVNLNFDDDGALTLTDAALVSGGVYRPVNALATFDDYSPNGSWGLYVNDMFTDAGGGAIAGGWSLTLETSNENRPPVIGSNGGGDTAAFGIAENQIAVTAVAATDPDAGSLLSYSISGGADASLFSINPSSGELSFIAAPSFETPGDADNDNAYDVIVTATDNGNPNLSDSQTLAVSVTNVNEAPSGNITISGTFAQGQVLTLNNNLIDPDGIGFIGWQWQRSPDGSVWSNIANANATTFTPTQSEVNQQIRVRATYTDLGGTWETQYSQPTTAIANSNDAPTGNILIDGIVTAGQVLTANTSFLVDLDGLGALSYQWQRANPDGTGITNIGSNANTYQLVGGDVGKIIQVVVSYTDGFGMPETKTSQATSVIISSSTGTPDADYLVGTSGSDVLNGLEGHDTIEAGAGNDRLTGGTGDDSLIGGSGNDSYYVDSLNDEINETSTTPTEIDSVFSTVSWTLGGNLERLTLLETSPINAIGNALNNSLTGNATANLLDGLLGNDTLKGGSGADIFRFSTTLNSASNMDTISDFNVVDDTIQLVQTAFTALSVGTLPASQFRKGAGAVTAADADDYLIYNTSTGNIYYDADGSNGGFNPVQIAKVGVNLVMTAADFAVI